MGFKLLVFGYVSSLLLLFFGLMALIFSDAFIHSFVTSSIKLDPSTDYYKQWVDPPIDVYFNFYLFNLKNPQDFQYGIRPAVEQVGPFVFREYITKHDIVDNLNYTLTYAEKRSYVFVPEKSAFPLNKTITSLNMAVVTIANQIRYLKPVYQSFVELALQLTGEDSLFVTKSVNDILFGYQDNLLKILKSFVPELVPTDIVGLFAGKNNSVDGIYTVFTGADNYKKIGIVNRYNYSDHMNVWSTNYANMINGTDGTLTAPFVKQDSRLYIFESDLCRSLYANYNGTYTTIDDIKLYQFAPDEYFFGNVTTNPDNGGFCTPAGNCLPTGVINITSCVGAPIISSCPHFLFGDEKLVRDVDGLSPVYDDHRTTIYIEPITGVPMKAHKRLQFNTQLFQDPSIEIMKNIPEVLFPLFWVDENFEIDKPNADKFVSQVKRPLAILNAMKYVIASLGLVLLIVCGGFTYRLYQSNKRTTEMSSSISTNNEEGEREALLNNNNNQPSYS